MEADKEIYLYSPAFCCYNEIAKAGKLYKQGRFSQLQVEM